MYEKIDTPLFFKDNFVKTVWGGSKLSELFPGRNIPAGTGESWEISDFSPRSVVADGLHAGRTLSDIFGETFPFLVKYIDSRDLLSVQVHPDAEAALKWGCTPKNEMWHVIRAEKDSCLYIGTDFADADEIRTAIKNNSVRNHLVKIIPSAGDTYKIPAGTIHAIGSGVVVYEIQETSATTFRIYDWDRLPPRELHIEESISSVRFHPDFESRITPVRAQFPGFTVRRFPFSGFFDVTAVSGSGKCRLHIEKPAAFSVVSGETVLSCSTGKFICKSGTTCLISPFCRDVSYECKESSVIIGSIINTVRITA